MSKGIPTYQLDPEHFACPYCDAALMGASTVTGPPRGFKKGHITVCAHCAGVSMMGDSGFRQMPPSEIRKLPLESQNTINRLVHVIKEKIVSERLNKPQGDGQSENQN